MGLGPPCGHRCGVGIPPGRWIRGWEPSQGHGDRAKGHPREMDMGLQTIQGTWGQGWGPPQGDGHKVGTTLGTQGQGWRPPWGDGHGSG